ncbi:hypothetical protein FIBSPDRAFT_416729 [Athelia psychrophila]|uniref:Swi5-domain-containing protein n=1 Tax=Athelia psychrophila TaxID=1759441 RepID=A0A166N333_9AGAM|nr:hypothetical protein FIBSPDRAFT_416729 [Fibularhizoctonia sp. CBS 109695]
MAANYPAWPVAPPLTYGCSMFSASGSCVSVEDMRLRNSPEVTSPPTREDHSWEDYSQNDDSPIAPRTSAYHQATASSVSPADISPAPSPPASPAMSACSFSSLSEFQPSPIKLPFSVSIEFSQPLTPLTYAQAHPEGEPDSNSNSDSEPEPESGTALPLAFDFPQTSPDYYMSSSPPMLSSSPPISSPVQIFSSSPLASSQSSLPCIDSDEPEKDVSTEQALFEDDGEYYLAHTPPTSSPQPPDQELHGVLSSLKRARDDDLSDILVPVPAEDTEPFAKRVKLSATPKTPPPPAQKRPTFASQKLQHKKLAKPFRPLSIKKHAPPSEIDAPKSKSKSEVAEPLFLPPKSEISVNRNIVTPRAAGQFKSPLAGSVPSALSSIRLTPTIQSLDRKVQILKRAVKVRQGGDEATLENLVKKWTEAGREVAWEVWGLVKDMGGDVASASAKASRSGGWGEENIPKGKNKRGFEEGWGWDDGGDSKKAKVDRLERNWGWNVERSDDSGVDGDDEGEGDTKCSMKHEDEEEEKRQDTLGTMLRQLGIDPETLGWNEDEGEFADK